MRLILDTNVVLSGLIWPGPSSHIISACVQDAVELFTCDAIIEELREHLFSPRFNKHLVKHSLTPGPLMSKYLAIAVMVVPAIIPPPVIADPDEDIVLGAGVTAGADAVVTGDYDLLQLVSFRNIEIVTPAQLVARLP